MNWMAIHAAIEKRDPVSITAAIDQTKGQAVRRRAILTALVEYSVADLRSLVLWCESWASSATDKHQAEIVREVSSEAVSLLVDCGVIVSLSDLYPKRA